MKKHLVASALAVAALSLTACGDGTASDAVSKAGAAASSAKGVASSAAAAASSAVASASSKVAENLPAACAQVQQALDNKGQNAAELKTELEQVKSEAPPVLQVAITAAVANLKEQNSGAASAAVASASAQASAAGEQVLGVLKPVCETAGVTLTAGGASGSASASASASPSAS
ncbi:MAG: hypothetical protein ACH36H_06605 [Candidatus Nanopelagicales bacterium]